jgi:uncharacterized protein YggE
MKRIILVLGLGGMLQVAASPVPDFPFVTVSGRAEVEVAPDKATVTFTMLVHDVDPEAASGALNERLKTLVEGIIGLGVDKGAVVADDLNKNSVRERDENRNELKILGYDVSRGVQVTIEDIANYNKVISLIMKTKNVTSVSSKFDTRKRDELEAELVGKACADAKRKALLMCKGTGAELGDVFAISDRGFESIAGNFGFEFGMVSAGGGELLGPAPEDAPVFIPAKIEIEGWVEVLYRLGAAAKGE